MIFFSVSAGGGTDLTDLFSLSFFIIEDLLGLIFEASGAVNFLWTKSRDLTFDDFSFWIFRFATSPELSFVQA